MIGEIRAIGVIGVLRALRALRALRTLMTLRTLTAKNPPLVSLPYDRGGWEGWSYLRSAASPSRRFGGVVEQKVAAGLPLQGAFGHSEFRRQRHSLTSKHIHTIGSTTKKQ